VPTVGFDRSRADQLGEESLFCTSIAGGGRGVSPKVSEGRNDRSACWSEAVLEASLRPLCGGYRYGLIEVNEDVAREVLEGTVNEIPLRCEVGSSKVKGEKLGGHERSLGTSWTMRT